MTAYDPWTPFLTEILDLSRSALQREDRPAGRAFLSAGSVAWDDCCAGQLYLRVRSIVPVAPTPASAQSPCPHMQDANLTLGVLRCASTLDDFGKAPDASVLTRESAGVLKDSAILMKVLTDEMPQLADFWKFSKYQINAWSPLGPEGGCGGGEWEFALRYLGGGGDCG